MINILYENQEWMDSLAGALEAKDVPFLRYDMTNGGFNLEAEVPVGLYFSRMSASAHSRGHGNAPHYAACILEWASSANRKIVNGASALRLECSKAIQYRALMSAGIAVPSTAVCLDDGSILRAADSHVGPFVVKPNCSGKGLGVVMFTDALEVDAYLSSADYQAPVDGITLVQERIVSPEPFITRVEFIGRKLLYAVRVDTSRGVELCPADACEVSKTGAEPFEIISGYEHPLVTKYEQFMHEHAIDVASFEFIVDENGKAFTYDINTNTNYNSRAEQRAGVNGMDTLIDYLCAENGSAL